MSLTCPDHGTRLVFNEHDEGVTTYLCPRYPDCTHHHRTGEHPLDARDRNPNRHHTGHVIPNRNRDPWSNR